MAAVLFPLLVELRAAAEWRPYFLVKMEAIHKSVMSRSELVFAVFFQKLLDPIEPKDK